ncbi:MAG: DUF3379 domain-containing protein [Pseudomonadales bacterium]|nr:DUF3379 domain-containing protein [Pseudomonadales bacterium]
MDELEFRQRVYANPEDPGQDVLDAAANNPALQKILDETRHLDARIQGLVSNVVVPEGLKEKLLEIPDSDTVEPEAAPNLVDRPAANSSFFHYYAIAASLLLVIGVTFTLSFNSGPNANEIAIGDQVVRHLYSEAPEMAMVNAARISVIPAAVNWADVDTVLAGVGLQMANSVNQQSAVFYANPCIIFPEHSSAHLMLEGSAGAVNVFVIQNTPVRSEFQINDERFDGMVVPMEKGNLILLGEDGENLDQFKNLISDNMEWVI